MDRMAQKDLSWTRVGIEAIDDLILEESLLSQGQLITFIQYQAWQMRLKCAQVCSTAEMLYRYIDKEVQSSSYMGNVDGFQTSLKGLYKVSLGEFFVKHLLLIFLTLGKL
jgi:hypothetical protein